MGKVLQGQMSLDLFPGERKAEKSPLEGCIAWLTEERGCDEERVRPLVEQCYATFGRAEAFDRARELEHFYGRHAAPRFSACPPALMGMFDPSIDYHTLWDRCWAARWIPLREAMEVKFWHYNYRHDPYTGAPAWVWYIDNSGREVKRPYEE